jgi:hypothetical protein
MTGARHQLIEHPRVGSRAVSGDLDRERPMLKGTGEEAPGGRQIPRFSETNTSMTCPNWSNWSNWSMARYRYTHRPAIFV